MTDRRAFHIKADIVVYAESEGEAMVAVARHFAWQCRPMVVGMPQHGGYRMGGTVEVDYTGELRPIGMTSLFGPTMLREYLEPGSVVHLDPDQKVEYDGSGAPTIVRRPR